MKIIDQSHEILAYDGLELIERAGRTCYKSEAKMGTCTFDDKERAEECKEKLKGNCPDYCPWLSSQRFASQLIKRGHEAMLEHAGATVKFITNRGVTHELVRHRVAAFAQESTRYVKYDAVEFIRPVWMENKPLGRKFWMAAIKGSERAYRALLMAGWMPEEARDVLPNALKTEIVVTANYREWRHILNLRAVGTTGRPHPQMQALMMPLLEEFKQTLPALFEDLEASK